MASLSIPIRQTTRTTLLDSSPTGILIASDGREPSDAALIAARKLAPHGTLGVLSVVPSSPPGARMPDARMRDSRMGATSEEVGDQTELAALIEAQLHLLFGESPDVRVETSSGYPPAVIASYAALHETRLLITGIGRARVIERLRGDESTLTLVRLTKTPVLAVAAGSCVPPRRIVVAMDFTPASLRAARLALELAAPHADVIVAHVCPKTEPLSPDGSIRRVVDDLEIGFNGRITPHILHGDPATEVLTLANAWPADLIAIGLHDHDRDERVGIGAVATRVIRCASCAVVVAPRDARGATGR